MRYVSIAFFLADYRFAGEEVTTVNAYYRPLQPLVPGTE